MVKVIYKCELCGNVYPNMEQAAACQRVAMRDFDPANFTGDIHIPKVGDVVACSYPAFERWEGDPEWSIYLENGGRFLTGYYALWVVTAKIPTEGAHRWRYILWSPSDVTGQTYMNWTGPDHIPCQFHRKATDEELAAAKTYMAANYQNLNHIPIM